MSLPHALLGLINYHPSTGYRLKAIFNSSIHFFWNAPLPQIYHTLQKMEKDGWIDSTIEHQAGKPSRKIYQISSLGREELSRWLNQPAEIPQNRNPMLVKLYFGNQMPLSRVKDHLKHWREYHQDLLNRYEKEVAVGLKKESTRKGFAGEAYFWEMTLDFGSCFSRTVVDWCDRVIKRLETKQKKKIKKKV